jgi:hypothetical protein
MEVEGGEPIDPALLLSIEKLHRCRMKMRR